MKTAFFIISIVFLGVTGGIIYLFFQKTEITSFEECVRAGFPVDEDNRAKCTTDSDQVFYGLPLPSDNPIESTLEEKKAGMVDEQKKPILDDSSNARETAEATTEKFDPLSSAIKNPLPDEVLLTVPFTPQAPHANWDPPFDEACEEAALIIVEHYLSGQQLSPDVVSEEIKAIVEWEIQNGYAIDMTAEETVEIAKKYYSRNAIAYTDEEVTIYNIKSLLAAGYPVIIPAAGQLLENPYFSGDGPPYHMLVLIGYRGDDFITNDPGTRRGEKFVYPQERIVSVIHDWTGEKETIRHGKKAMIVMGE